MKKIFTIITLLLCLMQNPVYAQNDLRVIFNGEVMTFDAEPFIENGRTLVPIRAISEKMECSVDWNEQTKTVTIINGQKKITLKINKQNVLVFDIIDRSTTCVILDVPAKIYNGRTFIPLRAVSEILGADVNWNGAEFLVTINYDIPKGVEFTDEAMEYLVRQALIAWYKKGASNIYEGKITQKMLLKISAIEASHLPEGMSIKSLEDLKLLPNCQSINLKGQNISDITPLSYIKTWQWLQIKDLKISDFSVLKEINVTGLVDFPNNVGLFSLGNNLSYDDALQMYEKIMEKVSLVDKNMKNCSSDYEIVKEIHDYMVTNMDYDLDYVYNSFKAEINNPLYLGLVEGKGICDTYMKVFQYLCNRYGIECINVISEEMDHSWNIVTLNGRNYHVDVTWDDPIGLPNDDKYSWFLLSDNEMLNAHIWDKSKYPKCEYSYK